MIGSWASEHSGLGSVSSLKLFCCYLKGRVFMCCQRHVILQGGWEYRIVLLV